MIRRKNDHFIKLEREKWQRDFDKIWDDCQKQVNKNQIQKTPNDIDYFVQLLKDQYNLFSLDSMDNHRMSMTKIFERYITQYIIDAD